jgi:hypothetical protein
MRLSEAAKQYEECTKESGPCLVKDCPLSKEMTIKIGSLSEEFGQMTWKVEGCTLMGLFEDWLKNKKPGKPYED